MQSPDFVSRLVKPSGRIAARCARCMDDHEQMAAPPSLRRPSKPTAAVARRGPGIVLALVTPSSWHVISRRTWTRLSGRGRTTRATLIRDNGIRGHVAFCALFLLAKPSPRHVYNDDQQEMGRRPVLPRISAPGHLIEAPSRLGGSTCRWSLRFLYGIPSSPAHPNRNPDTENGRRGPTAACAIANFPCRCERWVARRSTRILVTALLGCSQIFVLNAVGGAREQSGANWLMGERNLDAGFMRTSEFWFRVQNGQSEFWTSSRWRVS